MMLVFAVFLSLPRRLFAMRRCHGADSPYRILPAARSSTRPALRWIREAPVAAPSAIRIAVAAPSASNGCE
jgi:hypothetical protein